MTTYGTGQRKQLLFTSPQHDGSLADEVSMAGMLTEEVVQTFQQLDDTIKARHLAAKVWAQACLKRLQARANQLVTSPLRGGTILCNDPHKMLEDGKPKRATGLVPAQALHVDVRPMWSDEEEARQAALFPPQPPLTDAP
ncbi:hypothetical protein [Bosea sp. (in: a-proteobacteria)]|uniref:hypothetical protein n=1 Tax=Bosea sp. (in: a-proteobacteria) TaxID=1871050 RepID=UPI0040343F80